MKISAIVKILSISAVLAGGACYWILTRDQAPQPADNRGLSPESRGLSPKKTAKLRGLSSKKAKKPAAKPSLGEKPEEIVIDGVAPAYQKLARGIVTAIDTEDLEALRKLVTDARKCPDDEVRQRMVDALGWFGKDTLVELTGFLADRNPEVARSAFNSWESAVDQVEDEPFRLNVAKMAMQSMTDKENLQSVASKFESAEDQKAALNALAEISESNPAALDAVKEAYQFITGEEWRDASNARLKALIISRPADAE